MADEPVKKKRRSKWDQPAAPPDDSSSSSSTSDKVDPSVSAACAAARINAMLEAKGKINKKVLMGDGCGFTSVAWADYSIEIIRLPSKQWRLPLSPCTLQH